METTHSSLFSRLKSSRRLPSPPGAAVRVLELCRSEDPGLKEISDVITADPALSARILKFANSPATGLARKVTNVREAVMLMGLRSVKLAALGFCLSTPENEAACPGFDLRQYWSEACATAVIARCIAKEHFKAEAEEAFTAGLLSGIGRLAMAQGVPEEYSAVLELNSGDLRQLIEAERQEFETSHAELGAELLADWGLPPELIEAVRQVPEAMQGKQEAAVLSRVVATAAMLTPWFVQTRVTPDQHAAVRRVAEMQLGLDSSAWDALCIRVREGYATMAEVLNMRLRPGVTVTDLYAEAQEEASRVGMVAQMERVRVDRDVAELRKRAMTDALTGASNRACFDERLNELLREIAVGRHFGVVLVDIDHFKAFNDAHGHQIGDLVLTRVARALQNTIREADLLARYGGEEFAILIHNATREQACMAAAKANKTIEALQVLTCEQRLKVTISVGVSHSMDWRSPPTAMEIMAEADKQMYLSKQAGRNAWSYRGRTASRMKPQQQAPKNAA